MSRKINKRKFKFRTTIIGIILLSIISLGVVYANYISKGELNDDGQINYDDVNILQQHLIHKKQIPQEKIKNADMNNDGKITVTDVSLLINKIENIRDYKVEITQINTENYYINKNQDIEISFIADINYPDAIIKTVTIDGNDYEVQQITKSSNMYTLKLNVGNNAGKKEFKFTKVTLNTGEEAKIDNTFAVIVLKQKPYIDENSYKLEETFEGKANVTFELKDEENSIISSQLIVYEKEENKQIIATTINAGENKQEIPVEDGKTYVVEIIVDYNLASEQLPENEYKSETFTYSKEFTMNLDYKFEISNIQTLKDGKVSKNFTKGEQIQVLFDSTNSAFEATNNNSFEPVFVTINEKNYQVTKQDNHYSAIIDGINEIGNKQIIIQKVKLGNGKEFILEKDNVINVIIEEKKPTVNNFEAQENTEDKNMKVKFEIEDESKTIQNARIELYNNDKKIIDSQNIEEEEIAKGIIEKTLNTSKTTGYTVKIIATYKLTESTIVKNEVLFEKQIPATIYANIIKAELEKTQVEKNEKVKITYEIETNSESNIEKICVNNVNYEVTKISENIYEVIVKTSKISGILPIETTKVIFEDKTESSVKNTLNINVLKEIPTIQEIIEEDNVEKKEIAITFKLNDIDNSYISGKIQLSKIVNEANNEEQIVEQAEMTIDENKNGKVIFHNIEENTKYIARFFITYNIINESEENTQKDQLIEELPIILIHDYKLQVSDLHTFNKDNETKYFNKNEEITLSFNSTNTTSFVPEQAIINGNTYILNRKEGTNTFKTILSGYDISGIQEIKIEKIILSNNVELDITEEQKIQVEILKDKPIVTDFSYNEDAENKNKVKVNFTLNDKENTLVSGKIIITDKNKTEIKSQDLQTSNNEITFDKTNSEYYYVKVVADYNLGIDGNNLHNAQNLLEEEMDFANRKIQMKDILDVYLYKKNGEKIEEVSSIYTHELANKEEFLVKVEMKDMPDFYAPLKGYREENNILKLELEYENVVQYENEMKQDKIEVDYGTIENGKATNNSLTSIINQMRRNPTGTFNLTRDYDASTIPGDHRSLVGADITFKGTLNGNGHKIYNLSKPIFDYIEEATIKDLVLEDIYLSNANGVTGRGALANEIKKDTTISNVHVKNIKITTSVMFAGYGGITGKMTGSKIKECSVTNITISGPQNNLVRSIGGIVGHISYSEIENSYATGSITGNKEIGGIVGLIEKYVSTPSTIKNCISKINITAISGPSESGGIVGYAREASQIKLKQNISLSTGQNAYKVYGTNATIDILTKNYALEESTLKDNNNIKNISKQEFNTEFCKNEAKFDETIWNLENCNYEKLPTLKNADPNNIQEEQEKNNEYYIPDKDRLQKMPEYNKNKEILYSNLYKIMPFYDAKYLVLDGAKIGEDDSLNKELIKTILPYDNKGNLIIAITKENYNTINNIKVVFNDDTTKKYTLKYKDTYGNIAIYQINELNIDYNFDKYIIKQDATIVKELSNYIQNLEYEKDLQGMVSLDRGHPAYKVNFNEFVRKKENATNFVYKYLSNAGGYSVSVENDILNALIRNKLMNNNEIKRILFAYNYYSRFYGINMDGANLYDIMLFKGEIYRENTKVNHLISDFWNSQWKNSHVNYQYYRDTLAHRFGISKIGDFIDYNIKILTDYKDPNDWFTDNFKGLLVEQPAKGYEEKAEYRAWTQLKKRSEYILALLTLPENAGYMISTPAIFFVGSQRVYITNPEDKSQQQELLNKMKNFAQQVSKFYETTLGFVESSYLNNVCDIGIDTRFLPNLGEQFDKKTNDLFHQNFNEILNEWSMIGGVGAYAGSQRIYFVINHTLTSYSSWTHETGHNQTARIFFKNNGFRPIGGGASADGITGSEDYTDGNTTQNFGDGDINFNLSYNYSKDQLITTNLTTERINTTEKIESYYKRMFETIDFLDYAEAKAFLELTPEEQSKVAVQIYYPNAPEDYSTVGWKPISKEEFEKMNLKTVDDLWSNQITIKPGITENTTQTGVGAYGSEGMYIRRWYQPYNENGRTHTFGFKYTAWQMLGVSGYNNGYVTYYSGRSRNDLDAIKKVTNDTTMTWEKFKKQRYKLMQDNWNNIEYLNPDELVQNYIVALKTDAQNEDRNVTNSTNIRRINYHYLKRATDDFRQEVLNNNNINKVHIKTAEEFKQKLTENPYGYYVLDNDINVSSLNGKKAIVEGYFMGKLDGQGNKITGNTLPIFECLKFAQISNINIENSNITSTEADIGVLSKKAEYSELENIIANKINITSTNKQIGGLVGNMINTFVKNTHIKESTVSGEARVGTLVGYVTQSQIEESTANGKATAKGNAVGAFIGEIQNKTSVKNCYSIGEAKGNQDIGGFIGYVNNSSIINCFSNAKATGNAGIASFVGQTKNNSTIKNNITLVNQLSGYKFDGRTANNEFAKFSGNYENKGNSGISTTTRTQIDFNGKINIAEESEVESQKFYEETLKWNNNIWDFSKVENRGLPKLKNLDPNDMGSIVDKYTITTAEQFEKLLNEHKDAIFSIEADIDLSQLNLANKNAIITGEFMGKIEGNNHTLKGNKIAIFENLKYARISDLKIDGTTISSTTKNIGALAQKATYAEVTNLIATNIEIKSTNSQVGGLIGIVSNSQIENVHIQKARIFGTDVGGILIGQATENTTIKQSSSSGNISMTGNTIGGLVGEVSKSSKIENSYSLGSVKGNTNVGGIVGVLTNSTITKSFSSASANGTEAVAGFIGKATNNSIVQNNISLGNQYKQYKFDGATTENELSGYKDNYEYENNKGTSTLEKENINLSGKISIATKNNISNIEFYTNTLGWSKEIWDFGNITNFKMPKLKNNDPNESMSIELKENINTVDEFIEKMSKRPDGEYVITSDLDFSDKEYKVGSVVIPGVFFGKIEGNNHTIKNIKNATLFEQFNGEVSNLNIENFQHGVVWNKPPYDKYISTFDSDKTQNNVAAFTKSSADAKFYNMKLNRIIVIGNNNIATMTANDVNSTFENISVTQAFTLTERRETQGKNASTFISEKNGGTIKNCYVQGEMHMYYGDNNGAIIGLSHGDVTIENVVSNVIGRVNMAEKAKTSGLFIGKIEGKTIINNSVSIGKSLISPINKFATIPDENNIQFITNCYENADDNGISNSNGINIKTATKEQLLSKEFYTDILHFDENIWNFDNIQEKIYSESPYPYSPNPTRFPTIIELGGLKEIKLLN